MTWPDQQRSVHRVHGDAVGRGEFPVREDGLDDLETVGEPADAAKQCGIIHVRRRRGGKPDDDFRLDLRLGIGRKRQWRGEIVQRAVVDIAPVRRAHAVFIPDTAIGETGLAADGLVSFAETDFVSERAGAIGLVKVESRIACREQWQRTSGPRRPRKLPARCRAACRSQSSAIGDLRDRRRRYHRFRRLRTGVASPCYAGAAVKCRR